MRADLDSANLAADIVAAARQLSPEIVATREETERLRHLPLALADTLADAGLYRLYLPCAVGGLELPPATAFEVIEVLSKADGSVGWCIMNANAVALGAGWLAPEVGRQMFGQPPNIRAAGSLRPQGRAWPVECGYQLCGKWNFASGVLNANWLFCPALIMDGDKPRVTPAGTPATRTMWVAASAAIIIDNWSVVGMRGTGSHDFTIDNLFVPEAHSISLADPSMNPTPLYRPRLFLTFAHLLFAANALGIARGAMDALTDMASRRQPRCPQRCFATDRWCRHAWLRPRRW